MAWDHPITGRIRAPSGSGCETGPVTPQPAPSGPAELLDRLTQWAAGTEWIEWLELAGSLGRGAGDALSDIDAGIGLTSGSAPEKLDEVQDALCQFAPVAAVLRQQLGPESTHVIVVYRDGRQLSVVVSLATSRRGLPPEATAVVDKAGRLATSLDRRRWDPDPDTRREWTFLACLESADALKHAGRGRLWRAIRSLNEARDHYLQLLAADEQLIFPQFGAVSLDNAGRPIPDQLADTLVGALDARAITAAAHALVRMLEPYVTEHDLDQLVTAVRPPLRASQ